MILCVQNSTPWIEDILKNILFPIAVASVTYFLFNKLDEYKKRKSYSILGVVILNSLIEEVTNGLKIILEKERTGLVDLHSKLPNKSWNGTQTFSDEILLRIIAVSKGVNSISFKIEEIKIHTKNYFDLMCSNWEVQKELLRQVPPIHMDLIKYGEAAEGVLKMLKQVRDLLEENSKKVFPK